MAATFTSYVTNDGAGSCGAGTIKVKRKGYRRSDGTKVAGTSYCATDRGKPGKGPETIPTPHKGALGGAGYTERNELARHRLLNKHIREYGYAATIGALQSRINLGHNTMSKRALAVFRRDERWVQRTHGDKTMAKSPVRNPGKAAITRKSGVPSNLAKGHAIMAAMRQGMSKAEANRLYNEGRLSKTGTKLAKKASKKKASKKKASKKKASKKKASKRTAKKTTKRSTKKRASKRTAKKTTKRSTKKKASKRTAKKTTKRSTKKAKKPRTTVTLQPSGKKIKRWKKKPACPSPRSKKVAGRRMQKSKTGSSGRPVALSRWCRNFSNLDVAEKDLEDA